MVNHILIVGPGRSGTTLLIKLMQSFGNVKTLDDSADSEVSILRGSPIGTPHPGIELIRSSEFVTVTKYPREAFELERVYEALRPGRLGVIFLVRDYRDVLVSKRGGYGEEVHWVDWPRCRAFETVLRGFRQTPDALEINYQDLVTEPDRTQHDIAEKFELAVSQTFTTCWNRMIEAPGFNAQTEAALRGVRPISTASISNWRKMENKHRLARCLDNYPEIPFCLFDWGYALDFDWVQEVRG